MVARTKNLNPEQACDISNLLASGRNDATERRIVMHIDFDYFYAQCEEIRNPSLKGAPLIVCVFSGRTNDSGVVSTANYLARTHGVKSGIPIKLARSRLSDIVDAVFLPVDMKYYSEISEKAMFLLQTFADKFERVGIDECYLDVSHSTESFEGARDLASQIKVATKTNLGLTCSVGVSPNKMLAKMASDFQKPDGMTVIEPNRVPDFIGGLEVDKISGIGPKTRARLSEMNVRTIGELASVDLFRLADEFGKKTGAFLYNAARGIDDDPVVEGKETKQIARIMTLKNDASTPIEMSRELLELCKSVMDIAADRNLSFRTVGVLIILNDLEQRSKAKSLKVHANSIELLQSTANSLLEELMAEKGTVKVRRLGVRLSEFQNTAGQNSMSKFMND